MYFINSKVKKNYINKDKPCYITPSDYNFLNILLVIVKGNTLYGKNIFSIKAYHFNRTFSMLFFR